MRCHRRAMSLPDVPEPLSRFVAQCIEPDAAKRFATTADMVAALARLDDRGKLRPIKRAVGLPMATAGALALLGLSGGVYWFTRPPVQHENVVLVIADMVNRTGDAAFDRTLEPVMKLALDDSTFITAFERSGMRSFGVSPTAALTEAAAQKVALEQGAGRGAVGIDCEAGKRLHRVGQGHAAGDRRRARERAGARLGQGHGASGRHAAHGARCATRSATTSPSRTSNSRWRRSRSPRSTWCALCRGHGGRVGQQIRGRAPERAQDDRD